MFLTIYYDLVAKYKIKIKQDKNNFFLDKWFLSPVREEIDFVFNEFKNIDYHEQHAYAYEIFGFDRLLLGHLFLNLWLKR